MTDIDLIRESIEYEQLLGEGSSDTVLRGEYLIPDTHPDVVQILMLDVKPVIINREIMQDKVYVEGQIEYTILYLAREEEKMAVHSVSYADKFSNYIDIVGAEHRMMCEAECYIEHIECSIINERKVSVEGIVKLKIEVFKSYQYEIVKGIDSTLSIQMLKKPSTIDKIVGMEQAELLAKSHMQIGMDKPQIGKIMKCDVNIHKKEVRLLDNKAQVSAFAKIQVLYKALESREVVYLEDDVYVNNEIEIDKATSDMTAFSDFDLDRVEYNIRQDDLGENRLIDIEALVRAKVKVMNKSSLDMIEDAYCPNCLMELYKNKYDLNVLHGHNSCETIVKDNLELEGDTPLPTNVIMTNGKVIITDKKVVEDKVVIEGIVKVDVIYRTNDADKYLFKVDEELPFSCSLDIPGTKIDMQCISKAYLENIEASIEANTIAVKAVVGVYVRVNYMVKKEFLTGISKLDDEVPKKKASLTIYVVQVGDTLWNIAKRYLTTIEELVKINNIENADILKIGDKILIPGRAII